MTPDNDAAVAALLVAAGRGLRAGGEAPKQYSLLRGRPILAHALTPFAAEARIGRIVVVIAAGDEARYAQCVAGDDGQALLPPVLGGETRQDSVRFGLRSLAESGFSGTVLVHDAARPFVSALLIDRAIEAMRNEIAAIPALPVTDTIKRLDESGRIAETPPRDRLVSVQTPQAFDLAALLAAHERAHEQGLGGFTDDAALMEWAGHPVATFAGETANLKLTHPEDMAGLDAKALTVRVGTGYDVHAFGPGDHVWLGGVRIAHERGVLAHSDGDVALHALADALLGALAEGDIGTHFPPSDMRWKGAASRIFVAEAVRIVRERGGRIANADVTLIAEAPKIGPHREAMVGAMAAMLGISTDRISVKATTNERLGFVGREEGIAAIATATVVFPGELPEGRTAE